MSTKSSLKSRKKKSDNNFFYDLAKITGAIPTLILMRPKIIYVGEKRAVKGGFMVSANHCSFFDPIVIQCIFWKRRIYSLATKDLYKNKLLTWLFDHMHCIQVDKQNFSLNSFHEVTRQLKRGKVVSIFPEGQVNLDSKDMLAFKSGVILMAHTAKVPILPVYLVPTKKWYNRRIVLIGDTIDAREVCGAVPTVDDLNRVGNYVYQRQQELKNFYYDDGCKNQSVKEMDVDKEQETVK